MKKLMNYLTALCLCAALLVPVSGAAPLTRGELAELLHAGAGSPAAADAAAWVMEKGKLTVLAGTGEDGLTDGAAMEAAFAGPQGVAVGDDGAVHVADTLNSAIRRVRNGRVETVTVRDASLADMGLVSPTGLLAQGNRLYICDGFARKVFALDLR